MNVHTEQPGHPTFEGATDLLAQPVVLQHSYADGAAPSDAEIATAVSAYTGAPTTADVIASLRSGDITDVSAAVRGGLAHAPRPTSRSSVTMANVSEIVGKLKRTLPNTV